MVKKKSSYKTFCKIKKTYITVDELSQFTSNKPCNQVKIIYTVMPLYLTIA